MTKYYVHMDAEERLPAILPRYNYYCAYEEQEND